MEYKEILVRTEVYLQKISAEIANEADKEVLKKVMKVIENLILKEE